MKHKTIIISLTILIILLLGVGLAGAQEPEAGSDINAQANVGTDFTYQGQLTNANSGLGSYAGLAVGVPGQDDGGGVNILYSSPGGLSTTGSQWFDQDINGIPGAAESGDSFGSALAVGDLNGDGYADLAVGVPWEDIGTAGNAGGVNILYGSSVGLSTTGSQWFDQDTAGIPGTAESDDGFGSVLAVGDLNGDEYADLAVGVPSKDIGTVKDVGGVTILYGSSGGLSTTGSQWFDQDTAGIPDAAEVYDFFGSALAVGDLNGDGYADLAVGVPNEDIGMVKNAGGLNILYGSPDGLSTSGSQWFDQDTAGIPDAAEVYDFFGSALAVGDLNGDGYADLAVGVPSESVGTVGLAGGLNILYGSSDGLSTSGSQWFDQDTAGIPGSAESGNLFGSALAIGDLNGDGYADLAVGVPYEDVGTVLRAGGLNILYGSSGGLSTTGSQWFDQDTAGIPGAAESDDQFGYALAVRDLNGDGYADLAVGVPYEDVGTVLRAGGVNILYGSSGGLSTTGSQWFDQGTDGIPGSAEAYDEFGYALAILFAPEFNLYLPLVIKN